MAKPATVTAPVEMAVPSDLRQTLQEMADQLHGIAQDMGFTNPNMRPITFATKDRWAREIEAVERRLRGLYHEGA